MIQRIQGQIIFLASAILCLYVRGINRNVIAIGHDIALRRECDIVHREIACLIDGTDGKPFTVFVD